MVEKYEVQSDRFGKKEKEEEKCIKQQAATIYWVGLAGTVGLNSDASGGWTTGRGRSSAFALKTST